MIFIAAFSVATCSFVVYGPLILTSLHGISLLTTGYIIAAESISWSVLSILVANAPPRARAGDHRRRRAHDRGRHRRLRLAVPSGSIPLILACAMLQGGGFGIAWPFVMRHHRRGRAGG